MGTEKKKKKKKKKNIWKEYAATMHAEKLVKISRDNIAAGRRCPGRPKRRWSDLIPD